MGRPNKIYKGLVNDILENSEWNNLHCKRVIEQKDSIIIIIKGGNPLLEELKSSLHAAIKPYYKGEKILKITVLI